MFNGEFFAIRTVYTTVRFLRDFLCDLFDGELQVYTVCTVMYCPSVWLSLYACEIYMNHTVTFFLYVHSICVIGFEQNCTHIVHCLLNYWQYRIRFWVIIIIWPVSHPGVPEPLNQWDKRPKFLNLTLDLLRHCQTAWYGLEMLHTLMHGLEGTADVGTEHLWVYVDQGIIHPGVVPLQPAGTLSRGSCRVQSPSSAFQPAHHSVIQC